MRVITTCSSFANLLFLSIRFFLLYLTLDLLGCHTSLLQFSTPPHRLDFLFTLYHSNQLKLFDRIAQPLQIAGVLPIARDSLVLLPLCLGEVAAAGSLLFSLWGRAGVLSEEGCFTPS